MLPKLAAALALVSSISCTGAAAGRGAGVTKTVTIDALRYEPADLTVKPGDTVVWINKDPFPHTATATTGAFDSGAIAPDKSWKFKFVKKGDLDYICTLHPTMKARLTVE
jgi:plastocyanin